LVKDSLPWRHQTRLDETSSLVKHQLVYRPSKGLESA
jgi:hypothetical protein